MTILNRIRHEEEKERTQTEKNERVQMNEEQRNIGDQGETIEQMLLGKIRDHRVGVDEKIVSDGEGWWEKTRIADFTRVG